MGPTRTIILVAAMTVGTVLNIIARESARAHSAPGRAHTVAPLTGDRRAAGKPRSGFPARQPPSSTHGRSLAPR
jgi:hypothetical protein